MPAFQLSTSYTWTYSTSLCCTPLTTAAWHPSLDSRGHSFPSARLFFVMSTYFSWTLYYVFSTVLFSPCLKQNTFKESTIIMEDAVLNITVFLGVRLGFFFTGPLSENLLLHHTKKHFNPLGSMCHYNIFYKILYFTKRAKRCHWTSFNFMWSPSCSSQESLISKEDCKRRVKNEVLFWTRSWKYVIHSMLLDYFQ